jgi:hypothetical protein
MNMADVIESTADGDCDVHGAGLGKPVTASPRSLTRTRNTIQRFLENCPDDFTVFELKRELEQLTEFEMRESARAAH